MVEAVNQNSALFFFSSHPLGIQMSGQIRKALSEAIAQNMVRDRFLYAQRQTLVQLATWEDSGGFRSLKEKAFRNKVFEFFFPPRL